MKELQRIKTEQSRLPKKFYDYGLYENLIQSLYSLDNRKTEQVFAKLFYDNLVVIHCGCLLKYLFVEKESMTNQ